MNTKNKRPMIGLIPLIDDERESYWMLPGYMGGVDLAGGLPLMLPPTDDEAEIKQLAELCDGFLFTGGHDVSPSVYGEERLAECGEASPVRDSMEAILLAEAIRLDKPVLGICRGIQLMNAVLGGTLYQDLPTQHPSSVEHHQSPPYDKPVHRVSIVRDSPLYKLLGTDTLSVNSYHHQAIKKLSPLLREAARSEDGLTEAVYMPDKRFVWAFQWHPEFSYKVEESSRKIFAEFVGAAI